MEAMNHAGRARKVKTLNNISADTVLQCTEILMA